MKLMVFLALRYALWRAVVLAAKYLQTEQR